VSSDVIQNSGSIHYGAVNPAAPAYPNNVTAGNTLIAVIGTGNSATVSSVTGGGTWAKAKGESDGGNAGDVEIWYCLSATGGATTLSITYSATPSSSATAVLLEIPPCSALDQTSGAQSTSGTSQAPGTLTPTVAGEFFIAGLNTNGNPVSAGVGMIGASDYIGDLNVAYQFKTNVDSSALSFGWTAVSAAWVSAGASFKIVTPRSAFVPSSTTAFISNENTTPSISVLQGTSVVGTIPMFGTDDNFNALSPDGTRLAQTVNHWTSGTFDVGALQVIDVKSLSGVAFAHITSGVGQDLVDVLYSGDGTKLYVTMSSTGKVYVYNASTLAEITTITTGSQCHRLALSPDGTVLYAANGTAGTISVISTATDTLTTTITVGANPWQPVFTPDGLHCYVPNGTDNTISVITVATNTVATTISTGAGSNPQGACISPDGTKLYVTYWTAGTVAVISTASNTITSSGLAVGTNPGVIEVSSDGLTALVSNNGASTVSVIATSGPTVTSTVTVGLNPNGITWVPGISLHYLPLLNTVAVMRASNW
jgi:YVTN family beta-propeller protein